jgi:putative transposase
MPTYKRHRMPGGTYFFTVVLANRNDSILIDHVPELTSVIQLVKTKRPFGMNAWVILPDHMHCLWTLPRHDADYPGRWWAIKSLFTRRYRRLHGGNTRKIWQNRYWEHAIRDQADFDRHRDYIHFNPVRHGYVSRAMDWPCSSFRYYADKGLYSTEWGSDDSVSIPTGE